MSTTTSTSVRRLGAALAVCALAVPVAAAQARYDVIPQSGTSGTAAAGSSTDLRSPDARDAALAADRREVAPTPVATGQDLRAPDTRDAALGVDRVAPTPVTTSQDLRAPDTRDAAVGYDPPSPAVQPVVAVTPASDGFDWGSAAIGAGILGLVLLVALGAVAGVRRRQGEIGA